MFVRCFVSEIICEQTCMFADLAYFLLRTFANEKLNVEISLLFLLSFSQFFDRVIHTFV